MAMFKWLRAARDKAPGLPPAEPNWRTDSWKFCNCAIEDKPAQVLVNTGIRASAPDPQRTTLLWVAVYCRMPPGGGFWDPAETETLDKLEYYVADTVTTKLNAAYVLQVTTPGIREYYFYAGSDKGLGDCVAATRGFFPEYKIESDQWQDAEWSRYLTFYDYATQKG